MKSCIAYQGPTAAQNNLCKVCLQHPMRKARCAMGSNVRNNACKVRLQHSLHEAENALGSNVRIWSLLGFHAPNPATQHLGGVGSKRHIDLECSLPSTHAPHHQDLKTPQTPTIFHQYSKGAWSSGKTLAHRYPLGSGARC